MVANGIALGLSSLAGVWLGWIAIPIVLGVLILLQSIERHMVPRLLIICTIVAMFGALRSPQATQTEPEPELLASTGAIGRVSSFPRPSGDGQRLILELTETCIGLQCIPSEGRVLTYVPDQNPPLGRGATIQVDWRFQSLDTLSPGYADFVISQNAVGSARASSLTYISPAPKIFSRIAIAQRESVDRIQTYIPGDAGALATGIVTGDESALNDQTKADFRATGTTHITAVSGQNVSLILGFLSLWYAPRSPGGRVWFHTLLIVVVWSYAAFVGLEPPALRAAIFASLVVLGRHVGRRPDPMTILCLTLGIMALVDPWVVRSVGYWLSALASIALCLSLPMTLDHRKEHALVQIVRSPVLASLATMPLVMMTFGSWSPMSIVANMVLGPIMSVAFPVCYAFAAITFIAPYLTPVAAIPPTLILNLVIDLVGLIAPFSMEVRLDQLPPLTAIILWTPIALGIWLVSDECHRWLRRVANLNSGASGN